MSKKVYYGRDRKKNNFGTVIAIITSIIVLATVILASSYIYVNMQIRSNDKKITKIKQEVETINRDIESIKTKQDEYEKRAEELDVQLANFQPIVIPDSLKNGK